MMKALIALLIIVLVSLQWRLWFGENSLRELRQLKHKIALQEEANSKLQSENQMLRLKVDDLRNGTEVLEQAAREELGLIKEGETFYLYIPDGGLNAKP